MDSSEITNSGEVDGNCISGLRKVFGSTRSSSNDETGPTTLSINDQSTATEARAPVNAFADYYNMNHKCRGVAVIFNHENFTSSRKDGKTPIPRTGTNKDEKDLKDVLEGLGFQVRLHKDETLSDLQGILTKLALEKFDDHDCLLIAVLTHGGPGFLRAYDEEYSPEILWTPFTAEKCKSLAGKPKLFFLQACRGDRIDGGITMRMETDAECVSYKIPRHSDILIAFSTIPGFFAWRDQVHGSWFIQALCRELKERAYTSDLLTILTFVNRGVAIGYESYTIGVEKPTQEQLEKHQKKEMPCFTSMLTRILLFTKKF